MKNAVFSAPFRVVIDGGRNLDEVPVRELASMLDGLAGLVARASADVLGRPLRPGSGRQEGPIEEAAKIRLASLTSGSIDASILPAPARPLPVGGFDYGAETLSERAFGLMLSVGAGKIDGHLDLARAVLEFVERHVGTEPTATLKLEDRRPGLEQKVVLDGARIRELRSQVALLVDPTTGTREITGRLFEANVETNSAQVRTPSGQRVDVEFDEEHISDIKRLLGDRTSLRGEVTFDRATLIAKNVHLIEILTGDQLGLDFGGADFWTDRPVSDLIAEAGVSKVGDPAALEFGSASDAEWAALYEVLGIGS